MIDGSNVFVDLDGRLKCRRGLSLVGSQLSPAERVLGIGSYEDNTGTFYPVAGTPTRWQVLQAGSWTDVSGGSFLTGNSNDPVIFTSFGSSGINYIIGANNADVAHSWHSGAASYSAIAASPISRSILTLANRVVAFNTVEGGTRYPFRVRWSAINDHTTWPALGFADLIDSACSIVGAALTSRISAVIYRQFAGWYMQAVPGGDPNAFAFDRIPAGDHMTGPTSAASIVIAEGSHFYFGTDGRIYQFNGSSIQPISDPIDPTLRSLYNSANPTRFHSTYIPAYRQLAFFFAAGNDTDPMSAVVFDLRRQVFEPIWNFPVALTASAEVRNSTSYNWTNWVSASDTWLSIPWATWDSIPYSNQLSAYAGDSNGNIYQLSTSSNDNLAAIPYFATWGLQRAQNELSNALIHYVEFYLPQTITDDEIIATFLGYVLPLSTGSQVTSIDTMTLVTTNQTTFTKTLSPGPANPNNIKSNLIQLILNASSSSGQFQFAGCTILLDVDFRGDPRQRVAQ